MFRVAVTAPLITGFLASFDFCLLFAALVRIATARLDAMGNSIPSTVLGFVRRYQLTKLKIWLDGDEASRLWQAVVEELLLPSPSSILGPGPSSAAQTNANGTDSSQAPNTPLNVDALSRDDLHLLFSRMAERLCEQFLLLNAAELVKVQKRLGSKQYVACVGLSSLENG